MVTVPKLEIYDPILTRGRRPRGEKVGALEINQIRFGRPTAVHVDPGSEEPGIIGAAAGIGQGDFDARRRAARILGQERETRPRSGRTTLPIATPEEAVSTGSFLSVEALHNRYPDVDPAKLSQPMSPESAEIIAEKWRRERKRQELLSYSAYSPFWTTVVGLPGDFAASFTDPLEVATALFPVVPATRSLQVAGRTIIPSRLALTQRFGRVPGQAIAGGIEGLVGNALVEPIYAGLSERVGLDYTFNDTLLNLSLGAALGSTIGGASAGVRALRGRPEPFMRDMAHTALAQVMQGQPVDVERYGADFESLYGSDVAKIAHTVREDLDALDVGEGEFRLSRKQKKAISELYGVFALGLKTRYGLSWDDASEMVKMDFAGRFTSASRFDPETLANIGSTYAAAADRPGLLRASTMAGAKKSADEIYRETGWFYSHMGWKFLMRPEEFSLKGQTLQGHVQKSLQSGQAAYAGKLGELIDYPTLFANYPDMADVPVAIGRLPESPDGMYVPSRMAANGQEIIALDPRAINDLESTLRHEIQHAIQERDRGLPAPPQPPDFYGYLTEYWSAPHEIEARLAERTGDPGSRGALATGPGSHGRTPAALEDVRPSVVGRELSGISRAEFHELAEDYRNWLLTQSGVSPQALAEVGDPAFIDQQYDIGQQRLGLPNEQNGVPYGMFHTDGRIGLFDRANLFTVLHESGHLFFTMMGRLAQLDSAPPRLKEDFNELFSHLQERFPDLKSWDQLEMALGGRDLGQVAQAPATSTPEFRRWFGESEVVDESGAPLLVHHGTHAEFDAFQPGSDLYGGAIFFTPHQHLARGTYAEADGVNRGGGRVLSGHLKIENPLRIDAERRPIMHVGAAMQTPEMRAKHGALFDDLLDRVDPEIRARMDGALLDEARGSYPEFGRLLEDGRSQLGDDVLTPDLAQTLDPITLTQMAIADVAAREAELAQAIDEASFISRPFEEIRRRAEAGGHDGVIISNVFDNGGYQTQYVAFEPTQFKSVDNRGTFDPDDPRFLYNRAGERDLDLATEIHEYMADAFVKYVSTGEAPTPGLARLFEAFKEWLIGLYKRAENARDVEITPEVKAFFDKLLAPEVERLEAARQALGQAASPTKRFEPTEVDIEAERRLQQDDDAFFQEEFERLQGEVQRLADNDLLDADAKRVLDNLDEVDEQAALMNRVTDDLVTCYIHG